MTAELMRKRGKGGSVRVWECRIHEGRGGGVVRVWEPHVSHGAHGDDSPPHSVQNVLKVRRLAHPPRRKPKLAGFVQLPALGVEGEPPQCDGLEREEEEEKAEEGEGGGGAAGKGCQLGALLGEAEEAENADEA